MPQRGRRPQHQSRRFRDVGVWSAHAPKADAIADMPAIRIWVKSRRFGDVRCRSVSSDMVVFDEPRYSVVSAEVGKVEIADTAEQTLSKTSTQHKRSCTTCSLSCGRATSRPNSLGPCRLLAVFDAQSRAGSEPPARVEVRNFISH